MAGRYGTDHELESLRRSLVMSETSQLALTRDQALALVGQLMDARARLRRFTESRGRAAPDSR